MRMHLGLVGVGVALLGENPKLDRGHALDAWLTTQGRQVSRQPIVARILAACGLNGLLPVYPSADSALPTATNGSFGY